MTAARTLDPTPARRDRARRAGFIVASPAWVGAAAWVGGATAIAIGGGAIGGTLLAATRGAVLGAAEGGAIARAQAIAIADPLTAVTALAAPILLAAAGAALLAHLALARGLWQPRRSIAGAPAAASTIGRRAGDAGLAAARAALVLAVALRFAVVHLGDAFHLASAPSSSSGLGALLAAAGVHVAIAAITVAGLDAIARALRHRADLRMTARERADDDRAAHGDRRFRAARRRAARPADDLALVLLGGDAAIAIAWHPERRPTPIISTRARGLATRALIAQARRRRLDAIHAPALVAALATAAPADLPPPLAAALTALLARRAA
ncbi:MAG: EscU/YscU/HrcU family type III secretion system export apparatus switch protein [Deltaproteobacteria bacterium]|nr:EscU/YscU/HrcU family type III secretion system export apparatus switch protein [Deltaproteobacteria bacterium]